MIDDGDVSVRTSADVLMNNFKKSRKAKDWDASEASRRILDNHEYYHHWHARERAFVAAQQPPSKAHGAKSERIPGDDDTKEGVSMRLDDSPQPLVASAESVRAAKRDDEGPG